MPVAAHVCATLDAAVPEGDIRTWAADLAGAMGADRFRDLDGLGVIHQVPQTEYEILPDDLPRPPCVLRVALQDSYYGPGYERGRWHEIAAVLEFLRRRVPGARVWYGQDSGDIVWEVTAEFLRPGRVARLIGAGLGIGEGI